MIHTNIDLLFMVTVACAMVFDLVTFRIPNTIPVLLSVLFVAGTLTSPNRVNWLGHLGAGGLMLVVGAALFHFRLLGGGDAKMMAAIALWFGWGLTGVWAGLTIFIVLRLIALLWRLRDDVWAVPGV